MRAPKGVVLRQWAKAAAVCARSAAAAGRDSDIGEPPDQNTRGSHATGPGTGFHAALPEGHDDSPGFLAARLYIEARLRQATPTGDALVQGYQGVLDTLPFQLRSYGQRDEVAGKTI
jgi:hypothetical protein